MKEQMNFSYRFSIKNAPPPNFQSAFSTIVWIFLHNDNMTRENDLTVFWRCHIDI